MSQTILGAILGTIGSLIVAYAFYRRATLDLRAEVDRLRLAITDLQRARHELEFRQTFDMLMKDRQIFWETMRNAYSRWRMAEPDSPNSIEELVDAVPIASTLPLPDDQHLREWAVSVPTQWAGVAALLWRFSAAVYPARNTQDGSLPASPIIPHTDVAAFHEARGNLAKFFNRLGKAAYDLKEISDKALAEILASHLRLCKVLTYLEPNLVLRTNDAGPGKSWLFKLQRWTPNNAMQRTGDR